MRNKYPGDNNISLTAGARTRNRAHAGRGGRRIFNSPPSFSVFAFQCYALSHGFRGGQLVQPPKKSPHLSCKQEQYTRTLSPYGAKPCTRDNAPTHLRGQNRTQSERPVLAYTCMRYALMAPLTGILRIPSNSY